MLVDKKYKNVTTNAIVMINSIEDFMGIRVVNYTKLTEHRTVKREFKKPLSAMRNTYKLYG